MPNAFDQFDTPNSAPNVFDQFDAPQVAEPKTTTAPGLAASFARGAAPYAVGAGVGGMIGGPPGVVAGVAATALTQFGEGLYNWLGAPFGHALTPQETTDKAFDAIGIRRPQTWQEQSAESVGGFLGGMAGIPVTPKTASPSGLTAPQRLLKDFESQGVSPNVPTIGQGGPSGLTATAGMRLPVVAPVIRKAVTQQLDETGAAAERAASQFGTPGDTYAAGSAIENALKRFANDKSQATLDYGQFRQSMQGAPPAPMANTLRVVNDMMGRFPNAPGLTGLFTKSPIARLREEIQPRTETIPAKTSAMLDQFGRPAITQPAQTVQKGGVMSMPEIEELRTQVGYQLEHPSFGPDQMPRAQLKRLYAAITNDMRNAARSRGPAALNALSRATTNYGIRMKMIDRLDPLVSGDSRERIFARLTTAAQQTGFGGDAGLLQAAKKVLSPQEWGDFGASVISRLGERTPGAKDVLSEAHFSPSSFVTNYAKLSSRAKDMIFGFDTPGSPRANLETLTRVSQAEKNVGKLANVSHSGELIIGGGLVLEAAQAAWRALTAGHVGELAGWGTAVGVGYGFAKMLMSPQFARWLYSVPKGGVVTPAMVSIAAANLLKTLVTPPSAPTPPTVSPREYSPPAMSMTVAPNAATNLGIGNALP
jgi:hypothetical protein